MEDDIATRLIKISQELQNALLTATEEGSQSRSIKLSPEDQATNSSAWANLKCQEHPPICQMKHLMATKSDYFSA